jgi:Xaa-Pro aminopeptidase
MLQPDQSRLRQRRLLETLGREKLDAVVLGASHHVYWASAHRPWWQHEAAFILFADGRSWLATANSTSQSAAADQIVAFEATWNGTQRQDQPAVLAEMIIKELQSRRVRRIGVDASAVTSQVVMRFDDEVVSIDADLWQYRRRKHVDELAMMRTAIACSEAMHRRAREIVAPGITEIEVFTELNAAAVKRAGEPLSALLGNDYEVAAGGGPARSGVTAKPGQLYILDLGPAYRGYFSDNSRAYSVDRKPTDIQMKAWHAIAGVFPIVERMAKPGVRGRDLYAAIDAHLSAATGTGLTHHLGHGVGLQPHEFPHLNPKWDDVLIEGEIFTAEPGLYNSELNGGIRLENQYLVTKDGVENLVNVPLELI